MTLLLSRHEVRPHLSMPALIDEMQDAFVSFGNGAVEMPQRIRIALPQAAGYGAFMPCSMSEPTGFGIKVNTNFRHNPTRFDLPRILGLIILLDVESGQPLAIMDSTLITSVRTAAVSGVAIRHLARGDAEVLGILGSGALSLPHIEAAAAVRNVRTVRVFSPTLASRRGAFVAAAAKITSAELQVADTPAEVVQGADIVVVCTNAQTAVLDGRWIREGACVIAVGGAMPDAREIDTLTVVRSRVVCDSWRACLAEAGDLRLPIQEGALNEDHIKVDLADVMENPMRGRTDETQITLFKSVGLAFEDLVAAGHVYRRALADARSSVFDFMAAGDGVAIKAV